MQLENVFLHKRTNLHEMFTLNMSTAKKLPLLGTSSLSPVPTGALPLDPAGAGDYVNQTFWLWDPTRHLVQLLFFLENVLIYLLTCFRHGYSTNNAMKKILARENTKVLILQT